MKIGIFDSGMGGLIVAHGIIKLLPQYDYVYLGDTARVPYGNRSPETIYKFTLQAVEQLCAQDCGLIILACNTASAEALRRIQQDYLPMRYPDRKVLGVLIPAAEVAVQVTQNNRIGVLATAATVASQSFVYQIQNIAPVQIFQQAAPLLVPLVENNELQWAPQIVASYLQPLLDQGIDTVILGCTHYPFLRSIIQEQVGNNTWVIGQDVVVPHKLQEYLQRHPEIESLLSKTESREYYATDYSPNLHSMAGRLFGKDINFTTISIDS